MVVRKYVEERFREAGWLDPNQPYAPIDIKANPLDEGYNVVLRLPLSRKEIPDAMLQLADEIEKELESCGYPTGVILSPTMLPKDEA
jgi:hypothetical protein